MINNIKQRSKASEITLCTLPQANLYTEQELADYNAVIRKYSTKNGFKLIDF